MPTKAQIAAFEPITQTEVDAIVYATSGKLYNSKVDPRRQLAPVHVKKYLAIRCINKKYEGWLDAMDKASKVEGDLDSETKEVIETCKAEVDEYLSRARKSPRESVATLAEEIEGLKPVISSMKYKFSAHAFEAIAYLMNLMIREVLVFTCDNCLSTGHKLTRQSNIPWEQLKSQPFSALYMGTRVVQEALAGRKLEFASEDLSRTRVKLTQYITNIFREITNREERFSKVLLGKDVLVVVNDVVYEVLDRYASIAISLLSVGSGSKTITCQVALLATRVLFQDYAYRAEGVAKFVLSLVESRIERIVSGEDQVTEDADDEPEHEPEPEPEPETESTKGESA